jgi:hypothetical protein
MQRTRIVALSVVLAVATVGVGLLTAHTIISQLPNYRSVIVERDAPNFQRYLFVCQEGGCDGPVLRLEQAIRHDYDDLAIYSAVPACYQRGDNEYTGALTQAIAYGGSIYALVPGHWPPQEEQRQQAATDSIRSTLLAALHYYSTARC